MLPILADWVHTLTMWWNNVIQTCWIFFNCARSLKKKRCKTRRCGVPHSLVPPPERWFPSDITMDFQGTGLQSGHLIVRSTVKAAEARIHVLDVGSGSKKWGGFNTPQSLAEWWNDDWTWDDALSYFQANPSFCRKKNAENQQLWVKIQRDQRIAGIPLL